MIQLGRPFDFSSREELLRNPENAAVYLAEFMESGDMELFYEGLRHVAKAQAFSFHSENHAETWET